MYVGVPAYCIEPLPISAYQKNKIIKNVTNFTPYTYREFSETKIADLDVEVAVNEHIVTLDVPMDDSEVVHVLKHDRSVDGDLKPLT